MKESYRALINKLLSKAHDNRLSNCLILCVSEPKIRLWTWLESINITADFVLSRTQEGRIFAQKIGDEL